MYLTLIQVTLSISLIKGKGTKEIFQKLPFLQKDSQKDSHAPKSRFLSTSMHTVILLSGEDKRNLS